MKTRRAFTLVELLVVIGIIAALVAILLPSLQKARRTAESIACASNLRQLAIGFHLYLPEYKMVVPKRYDGSHYWFDTMRKYWGIRDNLSAAQEKEIKVFQCAAHGEALTYATRRVHFMYAYFVGHMDEGYGWVKYTKMRHPSERALFADAEIDPALNWTYDTNNWNTNSRIGFYHPGQRANIACCDGHVETAQQASLPDTLWKSSGEGVVLPGSFYQ